jgi:hypothetical protein
MLVAGQEEEAFSVPEVMGMRVSHGNRNHRDENK